MCPRDVSWGLSPGHVSQRHGLKGGSAAEELLQLALAEDRRSELLRLAQLRAAGLLAGDQTGRLLRDRVGDLRAERLQSLARLLARERLERARDDVGLPGQRPFLRPLVLARLEAQADLAELGDERPVLLVREPLD